MHVAFLNLAMTEDYRVPCLDVYRAPQLSMSESGWEWRASLDCGGAMEAKVLAQLCLSTSRHLQLACSATCVSAPPHCPSGTLKKEHGAQAKQLEQGREGCRYPAERATRVIAVSRDQARGRCAWAMEPGAHMT